MGLRPVGDRTQRILEQRRRRRRERDQILIISGFHASVVEPFDDWREEFNREANRTYAILWGGYGKLSEKILQDCLGAEVHGQCLTFLDSQLKPEQVQMCKQCGKEFNQPRGRGYHRKFCAAECGSRFLRERRRLRYWADSDYRSRYLREKRERYATDLEYRKAIRKRDREWQRIRYATDPEFRERKKAAARQRKQRQT